MSFFLFVLFCFFTFSNKAFVVVAQQYWIGAAYDTGKL